MLRDKAAIVGIGYTPFSKNSGVSTLTLAAQAVKSAVDDAGLSVKDIDGLATHEAGDSVSVSVLAGALGVPELNFYLDQHSGGSTSHSIVGAAAMAVACGVANTVVCYRSLNSRSGLRFGRMGSGSTRVGGIEGQYKAPYGFVAPVSSFAIAAQAHMLKYGTTAEQLGTVSVVQRHNATMNARAMMRQPLTLDDYLGSRYISEPLRLLDCCLETDGACAVVVTSAERAVSLRQPPVIIGGAVWGGGTTFASGGRADPTTTTVSQYVAKRLFETSGIGPAEVDVAELYDCFSITVLLQLEEYGFCPKGEAGPFVESGATRLGGSIPVNTHGGFLSEGYIHGLNHVAEAVSQLRGQAGERQVRGAETALSSGQPGIIAGYTSALMLHV
jgi:acetyl-CoA acetyltransferase